MKKNNFLYIALLVIPLMVVGLAVSPDSVMIWDGETICYTSFMAAIEDSYVGWCAPVAALLNYVVFAMAVIYGLHRKKFWAKGILGVSVVAMFLTITPVLTQGDVKIVPNSFVAILLIAESVIAYLLLRKGGEEKPEKKQGQRLKKH